MTVTAAAVVLLSLQSAAAPCALEAEPLQSEVSDAVPQAEAGFVRSWLAHAQAALERGDLPSAAESVAFAAASRDNAELDGLYAALKGRATPSTSAHPALLLSALRAFDAAPEKPGLAEEVVRVAFRVRRYDVAVDAVKRAIHHGRWREPAPKRFTTASALRAHLHRAVVTKDAHAVLAQLGALAPIAVWVPPGRRQPVDVLPSYARELSRQGSDIWRVLEALLLHSKRSDTGVMRWGAAQPAVKRWLLTHEGWAIALETDCAKGWFVREADLPGPAYPAASALRVSAPFALSSGILRVASICVAAGSADEAQLTAHGAATLVITEPGRSVIGGEGVRAAAPGAIFGIRSPHAVDLAVRVNDRQHGVVVEMTVPLGVIQLFLRRAQGVTLAGGGYADMKPTGLESAVGPIPPCGD